MASTNDILTQQQQYPTMAYVDVNGLPPIDPFLAARLMALPDELCIEIVAHTVSVPVRISLLIFSQYTEQLCPPFKQYPKLLEIAKQEVVKSNTFFWPAAAPGVTPFASNIRHLELDIDVKIDGGDLVFAQTLGLPAVEVSKIRTLPNRFPHLETLIVNVDTRPIIFPGTLYAHLSGKLVEATAAPWFVTAERCYKLSQLFEGIRLMRFPVWRRNLRVKKKVVCKQSATLSRIHEHQSDPTLLQEYDEYAKAIYGILDAPLTTVYFGKWW